MRTPVIRVGAILVAGLGVCASAQSGRPSPQEASFPAPDAASVHVTVVDDGTGKPVVAAHLTIIGRQQILIQTADPSATLPEAVTDRAGEALIAGVPPGRICVVATKTGYEDLRCNPTDATDPRSIELVANEYRDHVVIRLARAGGVTGRVTDELGDPVIGLEVTVFKRGWGLDGPGFSPAATAFTDDTGTYRVAGLMSGSYLVGFIPHYEEARLSVDASAGDASDDLDSTGPVPFWPTTFKFGGRQVTATDAATPVPPPDTGERANLAYGPTFAPGTGERDATMISLARGEWRSAVDIRLEPTILARVEGRLVAPAGLELNGGSVYVVRADARDRSITRDSYIPFVDATGAFLLPFIQPGTYVVLAEAKTRSPADPFASTVSTLAGRPQVTIDTRPTQSIEVPVEANGEVTGRVVVASGPSPPAGFRGFHVAFISYESGLSGALTVITQPDGRFTAIHLRPGFYSIVIGGLPNVAIASVQLDGRDVPDGLFYQAPGQPSRDLVLTVTDRLPSVSGTVDTGTAHVSLAGWVVVFSVDRSAWAPRSMRVSARRPSPDGTFEFRNLPTGGYFIAAAPLESEAWRDAATLESLVPFAVQVSLKDSDHKTIVVRAAKIGGGE